VSNVKGIQTEIYNVRTGSRKEDEFMTVTIEGKSFKKNMESTSEWIKVKTSFPVKFAFLREVIVYQQIDEALKDYAMALETCCRRTRRLSSSVVEIQEYHTLSNNTETIIRLTHGKSLSLLFDIGWQDFYDGGGYTRQMEITTIQVLGDGD
jgi:hypothetical protein